MLTSLLVKAVNLAYRIYFFLILVRVVSSWVQPPTRHQFMRRFLQFSFEATEPVLGPIREMIPLRGIDLSPIIALFVLQIIRSGLVQFLYFLHI